jgi:hypothetical protein
MMFILATPAVTPDSQGPASASARCFQLSRAS